MHAERTKSIFYMHPIITNIKKTMIYPFSIPCSRTLSQLLNNVGRFSYLKLYIPSTL